MVEFVDICHGQATFKSKRNVCQGRLHQQMFGMRVKYRCSAIVTVLQRWGSGPCFGIDSRH